MALSSSLKSDSDPSLNSQSSATDDSDDFDDSSDSIDQRPFFPPVETLEAENIDEADFTPELEDQDSTDYCRIHGSVMNLPETTPSPNFRHGPDESFALTMSMDLTSVVGGTLREYSMSSHVTMSMLTLSCLSRSYRFGQTLAHQWTFR